MAPALLGLVSTLIKSIRIWEKIYTGTRYVAMVVTSMLAI